MMDKPSVGRVVHYVAYGTPKGEFPSGVCRAAMITEIASVDDSYGSAPNGIVVDESGNVTTIGICVVNPTGLFFNRGIQYNAEKKPGTWHWPERT